jgi:thioredoxin-related protein
MPQETKIFRVFVSSTFTDMKAERRLLQKNVFPRLEKFCEQNGAKFQAVDLRWGVSEESQLNQKTLDICLKEIARCQRITPKPNFIVLLGDRYGWQPLPTKIPADEMKQIQSAIKQENKELIEEWYRLDENAIPAEFVLQPRGEKYAAYRDWEKVEKRIRTILRNAVSSLNLSDQKKVKYHTSATHQEIMRGALQPPEGSEKPEEHVLAMMRHTAGQSQDKSAEGFIDFIAGEPDTFSKEQLLNLKAELKKKLNDNYITYAATWKDGQIELNDAKAFESKVYNFLEGIIKQQIEDIISPDEIEREVKLHGEFREKLTEHFQGRQEILNKIDSYLDNDTDNKPMSILGEPGSGKSSVMAKVIENYSIEGNKAAIVYRFIGTTSNSSHIVSLLQSICAEIAGTFDTTLESLAGEGNEKKLYEMTGMTEIFKKCLALATEQKPIVLFLDALDQLSETDNARALYWLPGELPEYTKLVVSSLPDLQANLSGTIIEQLPLLPEPEARYILDQWFQSIHRKLISGQYEEILQKFSRTGLPIYLKLAFERAKYWHSYDMEYTLHDDIKGIINDFMDSLEEEHGREFVEHVICYLLSGRYQGLAENEILEILVFDKEHWKLFLKRTHPEHRSELKGVTKIPIVVWSRLYLDLEPYLTERDADGVPIITFFHRQFIKVLRERYGLNEVNQTN